jgi:hypothetical protein
MFKHFFNKLKLYCLIGKEYIHGKINKHVNQLELSERGHNLAEYCARIILTKGEYQPNSYAEQMFETNLQDQFPELDRLSAASSMFVTLLPYLPLNCEFSLPIGDDIDVHEE